MRKIVSNPKFISIAAILLLAALATAIYFFTRIPDSSYQNTLSQLEHLRTSAAQVESNFQQIENIGAIDSDFIYAQESTDQTYHSLLDSIAADQVIKSDSSVANAYSKSKKTMESFHTDTINLLQSMKLYLSILSACSKLISSLDEIKNTPSFDTKSEQCSDMIKNAGSAPSGSFKDQYLTQYSSFAKDLLMGYRDQIAAGNSTLKRQAATSTIESIKKQITTLRSQKLDLLIDSPSSAIQSVQDVVKNRQKSFLR